MRLLLSPCFALLTLLLGHSFPPGSATKEIVITIDDLPFVSASKDFESALANTRLLLRAVRQRHVPVTAFVIGSGFEVFSAEQRERLYRCWKNSGADFGNHTWTHADFDKVTLQDYENEILKTESAMKRDLHISHIRYFRAPYLNNGDASTKKNALKAFLNAHGYTEAPVTLDTEEWRFATPYDKAYIVHDAHLMKRIEEAYVPYMESLAAFFEGVSCDVLGRDCTQIYLLHANRLTAKKMPAILKMLARRGYRFVSLATALKDPAFRQPETYVGSGGYSWLIRWALEKHTPLKAFPQPPKWISALDGSR